MYRMLYISIYLIKPKKIKNKKNTVRYINICGSNKHPQGNCLTDIYNENNNSILHKHVYSSKVCVVFFMVKSFQRLFHRVMYRIVYQLY